MMASNYNFLCFAVVFVAFESTYERSKVSAYMEGRLLRELLDPSVYNPIARPAQNSSDAVGVTLSVDILKIKELGEQTDVLDLTAWLQMTWTDFRLRWDPAEYEEITSVRYPSEKIWTPDIVLYNNFDKDMDLGKVLSVINHDGSIHLVVPARLRTICSMNMDGFPNDQQSCILNFGSWTYSSHLLNLVEAGVDLSNYNTHKEWNLLNLTSDIETTFYACCPEGYQSFKINFQLGRINNSSSYGFVLPTVLVSILVPLQCLIPPHSEEKLSLGGALLISMVFLWTALYDGLPKYHSAFPQISTYYSITMIWIVLSVIAGVFTKHIASPNFSHRTVPKVIRQVILPFLRTICCIGNRPAYTPVDTKAKSDRDVELEATSATERENATQVSDKFDEGASAMLPRDNSIGRTRETSIETWNEWYQLAVAIDRLLCALFVITIVIYSFVILTQ